MSQIYYTHDGNKVISVHRPSGEAMVTATALDEKAAEQAAKVINRAMQLNNDRKYTASARKYASLDAIPGYTELDDPYETEVAP